MSDPDTGPGDAPLAASLKGRLLVAAPTIGDPNFAGTVVLMIEHSTEGALGVVLNRPTEIAVAEHLPAWSDRVAAPAVVFAGGPVSPNAGVCLARVQPGHDAGWMPLVGHVGTFDLDRDPSEDSPGVVAMRIFAGYAGWAAHQLEAEIAVGGWFVVDAVASDALSAEPEGLWREVLRRQPGNLALFADYPPDPALN